MDKKKIRDEILFKRNNLSEAEHSDLSKKIMENFLNSDAYKKSKNIMAFINFGTEPSMQELIEHIISEGKIISIPITFKEEKKILPSRMISFNDLEKGVYGILTPKQDKIDYIDPLHLDLVITPGVAFDMKGYRIGYGGGYYDRFFEKYAKIYRMGYAFSFQVIDGEVPRNDTDLPIDSLVSDEKIIQFKR